MTFSLRIALLLLAAGLIGWGLSREQHRVEPLLPGEARSASGSGYINDASIDGYLLRDGRLYDVYTPLVPGQVQLKDCKT